MVMRPIVALALFVFISSLGVLVNVNPVEAEVIVIGNDTSAMRVLNYTWIDEAESNINLNALNMCRNRGSQYNSGFSGEICIFFINFSSVVGDNTTITNATFYLDYGSEWEGNTTFTIVNVISEDHINRYTDSIYSVPPGKYSPTHNNNPCGWTSKTNGGDSSSFNSSCNQTAQAQYFVSKPNTIAGFDVLHMINAARGKTNAILFYLNDSVGSGRWGRNEPIHITNSDGTKRPRLYLEGSGFSPVPPPPAPAPLVTIGPISRNVTSFHVYNETLGIEVRIKSYWPITSANITIYNSSFSITSPMTLSSGGYKDGVWTKSVTYNNPIEFSPSLLNSTNGTGNYSFYINATDGNVTGNSGSSWFIVHGKIENAVFKIPIGVQSPTNTTFMSSAVWANITFNETVSAVFRSLDGGAYVPLTNSSGNWNNQMTDLSEGPHNVIFYVNNSAGNRVGQTNVSFTVASIQGNFNVTVHTVTLSPSMPNQYLNITVRSGNRNVTDVVIYFPGPAEFEFMNVSNFTTASNASFVTYPHNYFQVSWNNTTSVGIIPHGSSHNFSIRINTPASTGDHTVSVFAYFSNNATPEIRQKKISLVRPKPTNISINLYPGSIFRLNQTGDLVIAQGKVSIGDTSIFGSLKFNYTLTNATASIPVEARNLSYLHSIGRDMYEDPSCGYSSRMWCKFLLDTSKLNPNSLYNLTFNATDVHGNFYQSGLVIRLTPYISSQSYHTVTSGTQLLDDAKNTNASLLLFTNKLSGQVISIATYNEAPKYIQAYNPFNTSQFVEFIPSWWNAPSLPEGSWVEIRMHYTDERIAELGLDESTLSLQSYNETTASWQICANTGVNTTGNYVFCNSTHFSIWGITGNPTNTAPSTSPSSSSGAASSGSSSGSGAAVTTTDSTSDTENIQTEETSKRPEANEIGTGTTEESNPTRNVTNERQENLVTGLFALGGANMLSVILAVIIVGGITSFLLWRKTVRVRKKS